MERNLVKHGLILIFLSLLTGLIIPATEAPRLALSAHTIAMISGVLLLALSAVWNRVVLSKGQEASRLLELDLLKLRKLVCNIVRRCRRNRAHDAFSVTRRGST